MVWFIQLPIFVPVIKEEKHTSHEAGHCNEPLSSSPSFSYDDDHPYHQYPEKSDSKKSLSQESVFSVGERLC